MLKIRPDLSIEEAEIDIAFIASPGPGGQNVNKVATTAQLRFNIAESHSLPEETRLRLLLILKSKLTNQGELIIKASRFRTQERNREDAINRLVSILHHACAVPKKRLKTKPTKASKQRRLESKKIHANKKMARRRIGEVNH
jgi:ribosome-associated protein